MQTILKSKFQNISDIDILIEKIDFVIDQCLIYEKLYEQIPDDEDIDTIKVAVKYNLLNRTIGELIVSCIKMMFYETK